MTVAAADRVGYEKQGNMQEWGVIASDIIYKHTLLNTAPGHATQGGYAKPAADAEGEIFIGVASERADNASGAADAVKVNVYMTGTYRFVTAGASESWKGLTAYIVDDQTVGLGGTSTTKFEIPCGVIVDVLSATEVAVRIDGFACKAWKERQFPVAATTDIARGNLVCENAAAYAANGADTAAFQFLGVAIAQADNDPGSAGDINVRVVNEGIWEFTCTTSLASVTIGDAMYVDGAATVDLAGGTANVDAFVGRVTRKGATDTVYVEVCPFSRGGTE